MNKILLTLGLLSCQLIYADTVYQYNGKNQLVQIQQNNHIYEYGYYASGQRAYKKNELGNQIAFEYDAEGNLSNESNGVVTSSYFGGFRYLSNGTLQSTFTNRHNTPKTTSVSKSGEIVNTTLLLNPYGKVLNPHLHLADSHQNREFDITKNAKVYGDGYRDFESGLVYMGARFYNPNLNRFMAQDSYDVTNRYNYADANPIMMYDPDGHMSVWEGINIGLNGLGLIGGVVAAFASGGTAAPLIGGILGAFSGITGGIGIGLKHVKGWEKESHLLDIASTVTGIASIIADTAAAVKISQEAASTRAARLPPEGSAAEAHLVKMQKKYKDETIGSYFKLSQDGERINNNKLSKFYNTKITDFFNATDHDIFDQIRSTIYAAEESTFIGAEGVSKIHQDNPYNTALNQDEFANKFIELANDFHKHTSHKGQASSMYNQFIDMLIFVNPQGFGIDKNDSFSDLFVSTYTLLDVQI